MGPPAPQPALPAAEDTQAALLLRAANLRLGDRKHDGGEAPTADPQIETEMLERDVLTNPRTTADFLFTLQRLTQASQMAQHSMWAMPSHVLPGFNIPPLQHASQAARGHQASPDLQEA